MSNFAQQYLGDRARILFILVLLVSLSLSAAAQSGTPAATHSPDTLTYTESVLYAFQGMPDAQNPVTGLVADSSGNLYGASEFSGAYGYGAVFELTPNGQGGWTYSFLYSLTGATDGAYANSLAVNGQGNLYGTTSNSVFELCQEPNGGSWILCNASVYPDVGTAYPGVNGPPVVDSAGNVYVTTGADGKYGFGSVSELVLSQNQWLEQPLYSFKGAGDSAVGVIMDKKGDFYGMTDIGPNGGFVFKLHYSAEKGWVETVLHTFQGGPNDGSYPSGNPTFGKDGNIYGTAETGLLGYGGVYKLTSSGKITWLYAFTGGADGYSPWDVTFDNAGNLYGGAGSTIANQYCQGGCGEVYKLTPPSKGQTTWTQNVLYSFTGGADGGSPDALGFLVVDDAGNVYGTTGYGGINYGTNGFGVVFKLTPNPVATTTTITKNIPNPSKTGQVVTVSFTVTQTAKANSLPTGTVTANASTGESCQAALPPNGKASCKLLFATAGTRSLTAAYSGDAADQSSVSAAVTQSTSNATSTKITDHTPDPAKVGQAVTVHFTVEATNGTTKTKPTGSVTVTASMGDSCTGTLSGADEGKCQLTFGSSGITTLTATYAGDADNEASVSKAVEQAVE